MHLKVYIQYNYIKHDIKIEDGKKVRTKTVYCDGLYPPILRPDNILDIETNV